jgi:DNA-binding response OmpR family regulator
VWFVYQAVPQRVDDRSDAATRVVLVLEVPGGHAAAAHAIRLANEFGSTIAQVIPGLRAHEAVVATPAEERGLTIDLADRRVSVDGRPLRLAYREFALFAHLAERPRQTVSRHALLQTVWGDRPGQDISSRVVDTHIRRLRGKLGEHAHVLTTVRGRGYRFDPGAHVRFRPKNHVGDKSRHPHSRYLA